MSLQLSEHFSFEEMIFSQTATRLDINNTPGDREAENLQALCQSVLEPLRIMVNRPIRITSGYRCLPLNRKLGSRDTSHHVDGRAADLIIPGVPPLEVCARIKNMGLPFDQLIHEFGRWTHVSIPACGQPPRRKLLTIDRQGVRAGLLEARGA